MGRRERQREAQRQRWAQIAVGLILVFLMVLSLVQFGSNNNTATRVTFNKEKFTLDQEGWHAKIDGEEMLFHSVPLEGNTSKVVMQSVFSGVTVVSAEAAIGGLLQNADSLQVTFDQTIPADFMQPVDQARFELSQNFQVVNGILGESDVYSLPVITCASSSESTPVIAFYVNQSAYNVTITREDTCITVVSNALDALVAKDYLILASKGVIPDVR